MLEVKAYYVMTSLVVEVTLKEPDGMVLAHTSQWDNGAPVGMPLDHLCNMVTSALWALEEEAADVVNVMLAAG